MRNSSIYKAGCLFGLLSLGLSGQLNAAGIAVQIATDDAGLNDATPVAAVTGNAGLTLGEQRMNVINAAIQYWQSAININSTVTLEVAYKRDVACSAGQGVLASAGYNYTWHSFDGAAKSNVWYPAPLAINLHPQWRSEQDIPGQWQGKASMRIDINAIGEANCLNHLSWYYGMDENPGSGQSDLFNVLKHEIGHALGFATVTNIANGQWFDGRADIFASYLYDADSLQFWSAMNANARKSSAINQGGLTWNGEETNRLAFAAADGLRNNKVRMYAPAVLEGGSSVSHFDRAVRYNTSLGLKADELMEPWESISEDDLLTLGVMADLGWQIRRDTDQDGASNTQDAFPLNAAEQGDWDGDGVGDNADAFPFDATEQVDSDGDGIGDNKDPQPHVANTSNDSDGDGVANHQDTFPNNPRESADADNDGIGDNSDPFVNDACIGGAFVVSSSADSGTNTLREAVRKVCPQGTISFSQAMNITLSNELVISQSLNIDAGGQVIVLDGSSSNSRAMRIDGAHNVTITGLRFSQFFEGASGGAIYSQGDLTIDRCTFDGNIAGDFGGGIYAAAGKLYVSNSLFYKQSATEVLDIYAAPNLTENHIIHNTFWRSTRKADRTAIEIYGSGELKNNLLAGAKQADFCRKNTRVQASHNLITDQSCGATLSTDPDLTAPDTDDFRPKVGSPAIDAGTAILVAAKDHNGVQRAMGAAPDIGAFEYDPGNGSGSNSGGGSNGGSDGSSDGGAGGNNSGSNGGSNNGGSSDGGNVPSTPGSSGGAIHGFLLCLLLSLWWYRKPFYRCQ